jgi:hypothetical protein
LAEATALVRETAEAMYAAQTDEALITTAELVAQLRSAAAAVEAGVVAEADHRDLAKTQLAFGSTGEWLTHLGGLRKGEGKRIVARAHALTGTLTHTREALVAGTVSPAQAEVILTSVRDLPSGGVVRARGERVLVEQAGVFDATDLARTGRHLVHVVDPDATDRRLERALDREERAAHHDRSLSIVFDGAGGVRIRGRGSAEDGETLKTVLLPLAAPTPATQDVKDQAGHEGESVRDTRDSGTRMWDALVAVAHHAQNTCALPESHGTPTRVLVLINLDELTEGLADAAVGGTVGVGVTGTGAELSAAAIRRLACDAEIIPVVLDGHGEPLDVGRARYAVPPAIWNALVVRDRHCAFPGCDRPPVMCHAHHITHWAHGGKTKLRNLVLLCGHHHRVIHHTGWEVRINPDDQKPEFLPPPKPGIDRHWIRHRPRLE